MKVLVVNAGSSSLKYQVFDMSNESVLAKGNCEKIGIAGSFIKYKANGVEKVFEGELKNHTEALPHGKGKGLRKSCRRTLYDGYEIPHAHFTVRLACGKSSLCCAERRAGRYVSHEMVFRACVLLHDFSGYEVSAGAVCKPCGNRQKPL